MNNAELIKALRCCVTDYNSIQSRLCNKCQYAKYADGKYGCENKLKADAADAIERLQRDYEYCSDMLNLAIRVTGFSMTALVQLYEIEKKGETDERPTEAD